MNEISVFMKETHRPLIQLAGIGISTNIIENSMETPYKAKKHRDYMINYFHLLIVHLKRQCFQHPKEIPAYPNSV